MLDVPSIPRSALLAWLLCCAFFAGCRPPDSEALGAFMEADSAYVPHFAAGFGVYTDGDFYLLGATDYGTMLRQRYLLVPRGTPESDRPQRLPADVQIIETPVRTVIATSTTQIAMLDRLGIADRIIGVSDAPRVNNPIVRDGVERGTVADLGLPGGLDLERIVALQPDLVLGLSLDGLDGELMRRVMDQGLPVAITSEFREITPLGRAEWLYFTSFFFDLEPAARDSFDAIVARYQALSTRASAQPDKPTVFLNATWRGTWYMAGGQNFMARFLEDAGADYLWADTETASSLPLDVEVILERAQEADYWLNPSSWASLEEGAAEDERYRLFEAWQQQRVYNNNQRLSEGGGVDFWESGVVSPDVILADLVAIFHPSLLPEHEFVYYQQLPRTLP